MNIKFIHIRVAVGILAATVSVGSHAPVWAQQDNASLEQRVSALEQHAEALDAAIQELTNTLNQSIQEYTQAHGAYPRACTWAAGFAANDCRSIGSRKAPFLGTASRLCLRACWPQANLAFWHGKGCADDRGRIGVFGAGIRARPYVI